MKETVFISGPMTGYPDNNKAAFMAAEKEIQSAGYLALNPRRITPIEGYKDYRDYWHINKAMLRGAMAIYMLPGWENSPGACNELHWALKHGLHLYNLGYDHVD